MTMDFEEDAQAAQTTGPNDEQLNEISTLARRLVERQGTVEALTEQLEQAQKALDQVRLTELPEAMQQVGLQSFTLATGEKVSVKELVKASIPTARSPEALSWLRANGHGDLIKNDVIVSFARGEEGRADQLVETLGDDYVVARKEGVHAQTLAAWVRERREQGLETPVDLFGVWVINEAKVSR